MSQRDGGPPCPFCGAESAHAFSALDRNQHVSRRRFRYRRCRHCATVFAAEIPGDLSRYYPPSYYPALPAPDELDRRAQPHAWRLEFVRAHVSSGQLVDVGAGAGLFAYLAKRLGFDVVAVEMDPRCCEYLRDMVGVRVVQSDDPATALRALGGIQVITCWHVLEHLGSPSALLESAAECVAPGGVLVVATPNVDSLQFRLLGSRWPHVDAPRHLALIPAESLRRRLADLGFECVDLTTADPAGEYNAFGWQGVLPGRVRRRPHHLAGRFMAAAAAPIERRAMNGSTYTGIFRKSAAS
jgi:2-polyprenyl-3-methyl-5-hydroxy-6-metoxy-1,4-benzoquinol methylase